MHAYLKYSINSTAASASPPRLLSDTADRRMEGAAEENGAGAHADDDRVEGEGWRARERDEAAACAGGRLAGLEGCVGEEGRGTTVREGGQGGGGGGGGGGHAACDGEPGDTQSFFIGESPK